MKKLKNKIHSFLKKSRQLFAWYRLFLPEILIVIVGFSGTYLLKSVPYASILLGLVPTLPLIVSIVLLLILLKPRVTKILKFAFLLLIFAMPLSYLHLYDVADTFAQISYMLFFSIIVINFIRIIKEEK